LIWNKLRSDSAATVASVLRASAGSETVAYKELIRNEFAAGQRRKDRPSLIVAHERSKRKQSHQP
jgi:hypothetical protein